jgi:hypothetical protein
MTGNEFERMLLGQFFRNTQIGTEKVEDVVQFIQSFTQDCPYKKSNTNHDKVSASESIAQDMEYESSFATTDSALELSDWKNNDSNVWELTIMLRNIPNKMKPMQLLEMINHYRKYFNFFYLRMDFKNNCSVGYSFINFTDKFYYERFRQEFVGRVVGKKMLAISLASIQGVDALVQKFRNSSVMLEKKEFRPVLLAGGEEIPFPEPEIGKLRPKIDILYSRVPN